jgi:amino acid transporter
MASVPESELEGPATGGSGLRAGSLDLSAVMMQSITTIGPALAAFFSIQFITATTGIVSPLALIVGGALILLVGITLAGLASRFPSAGGYYTYVGRTLHPRAGFLTSWVFFLWSPIAPCFSLAYVGYLTQQTVRANYGINLPWWLLLVVAVPAISLLTYFGIRISASAVLLFGLAEIVMVLILAIWGLADPGPGGLNVSAFNPANALSGHGFYLAVVFTIFAYVGWEGAAPLGEESRNPRRNVPLAIIGSILFMIAFLVLCAWAFGVGWGTNNINGFISDSNNPMFSLAHRFWGGGSLVVLLAVINSTIAFTVSSFLVSTRMIYAMGRTGTLPALFGRADRKHQTPVAAIVAEGVLLLAVGFIASAAIGLTNVFFFFGLMVTYVLIFVYIAGNIGAFWYHTRGAGRNTFSLTRHVILPVVSSIALVFVGYESINPLPSAPLRYAPIVAGVWILAGILLLVIMNRLRREPWLLRVGEASQAADADNQSSAKSRDKA